MILFVADSMMAEAYAPREGLCLAQHIGCKKFIIQSDNSRVIDIMLDGGFTATPFSMTALSLLWGLIKWSFNTVKGKPIRSHTK
jgi:hypothetical protein